jgi:hypothetical protein
MVRDGFRLLESFYDLFTYGRFLRVLFVGSHNILLFLHSELDFFFLREVASQERVESEFDVLFVDKIQLLNLLSRYVWTHLRKTAKVLSVFFIPVMLWLFLLNNLDKFSFRKTSKNDQQEILVFFREEPFFNILDIADEINRAHQFL